MYLVSYRNTMASAKMKFREEEQPRIPRIERDIRQWEREQAEKRALAEERRLMAESRRQIEDRHLLSDMPPRAREVVFSVTAAHGVTVGDLMSNSRTKTVVRCRDEVQYRLRALDPKPSLTQIGAWLHRDHTSVLNSVARYSASTGAPPLTKFDVENHNTRCRENAREAMRALRVERMKTWAGKAA